MLIPKILDHASKYGIWIVIDPYNRTLLNVKHQRISVHPESESLEVSGYGWLFLSDYGKKWFATKKEADRYCNSLLTF